MRLEGMYSTIERAEDGMNRLIYQGYTPESVTIVMSQEMKEKVHSKLDANIATRVDDSPGSVWARLREYFRPDDIYKRLVDETDVKVPASYAKHIRRGKIAVFLNSDAKKLNPFDPKSKERFD